MIKPNKGEQAWLTLHEYRSRRPVHGQGAPLHASWVERKRFEAWVNAWQPEEYHPKTLSGTGKLSLPDDII